MHQVVDPSRVLALGPLQILARSTASICADNCIPIKNLAGTFHFFRLSQLFWSNVLFIGCIVEFVILKFKNKILLFLNRCPNVFLDHVEYGEFMAMVKMEDASMDQKSCKKGTSFSLRFACKKSICVQKITFHCKKVLQNVFKFLTLKIVNWNVFFWKIN